MRRMKDIRGSHVSAIRTAIFRTFALTSQSKGRKNSRDIVEWKKSKDVEDSYTKLFSDEDALENMTNTAFPSLSDASEEKFNDFYIYTAAVCDIILNPNYPSIEVSKKALNLRLRKFRVFIEFILSLI
jgi:nitric oxide reductase large subunit